MTCHSSFCRAFSLGWGGRSYRYGPSRTLGSKRTVTSGVSTRVAIDRAPRLSAASGVTFTEALRSAREEGSSPCRSRSARAERRLGTTEPEPIEQEFVEQPDEALPGGLTLVLEDTDHESGREIRPESLQGTLLCDLASSAVRNPLGVCRLEPLVGRLHGEGLPGFDDSSRLRSQDLILKIKATRPRRVYERAEGQHPDRGRRRGPFGPAPGPERDFVESRW